MVEKLYKAIVVIVLTGIATAIVMIMIKWLIDMGFVWAMIALCAGLAIWRSASLTEK